MSELKFKCPCCHSLEDGILSRSPWAGVLHRSEVRYQIRLKLGVLKNHIHALVEEDGWQWRS